MREKWNNSNIKQICSFTYIKILVIINLNVFNLILLLSKIIFPFFQIFSFEYCELTNIWLIQFCCVVLRLRIWVDRQNKFAFCFKFEWIILQWILLTVPPKWGSSLGLADRNLQSLQVCLSFALHWISGLAKMH